MAEVKNIYSLVRKRFPEGEYALMQEVSDAAGFNRSRSADFMAMGLWPSRGLSLHCIEQKSFRSDWLSELKKPEKQENHFKYSDFFWLLTTDDTVAKAEEIPASWGWLMVKGEKIFTMKEAPKLSPLPLNRQFIAAMLKRASNRTGFVHIDQIQERIDKERQQAIDGTKSEKEWMVREYVKLKKEVDDFEKSSGLKLFSGWEFRHDPLKLGAAIKMVLEGGLEEYQSEFVRMKNTAQHVLTTINKHLELIDETKKDKLEIKNNHG